MEVLVSIGTFILGFFAEKVLEIFVKICKRRMEQRKRNQVLQNFYTDVHQDIVITASGFPYYSPIQIREGLGAAEPFLLAKPAGLEMKEEQCFAHTDVVTDDFKNYIMTNNLHDQLEQARQDVFESFVQNRQGNYFNGTLLGVSCLNGFVRSSDAREEPGLHIDFYKTDYYTHKIIERLIQNRPFESGMLAPAVNAFNWFRTSFGVSVILIIPRQNEIILTKRSSQTSYSDGREWLYVSVTETLSETDYNDETGFPDLKKCVLRGISEELGITERELKVDSLRFYDAFYETHFRQDNIVASIEIADELTFSTIYSLLSKDKFMEVSDILTISNDKKAIANFIERNRNVMRAQTIFSLESFAARL